MSLSPVEVIGKAKTECSRSCLSAKRPHCLKKQKIKSRTREGAQAPAGHLNSLGFNRGLDLKRSSREKQIQTKSRYSTEK